MKPLEIVGCGSLRRSRARHTQYGAQEGKGSRQDTDSCPSLEPCILLRPPCEPTKGGEEPHANGVIARSIKERSKGPLCPESETRHRRIKIKSVPQGRKANGGKQHSLIERR
jgi:hypothetical protein